MLLYMEFAGIHHKLHKQDLFNLNLNWPHFQQLSSLGSLAVGDAMSVDRVGKKRRKAVCRLHICDG